MEGLKFYIEATVNGVMKTYDGKKFVNHGCGVMIYHSEDMVKEVFRKLKKEKPSIKMKICDHKDLPVFIYHPTQCTSRCCTSSGEELDQIPYEQLFDKTNLPQLLKKYSAKRGRDFIVWKGSDNCTCLDCLKDYLEGKIDKWGIRITFVDVKCPNCSKISNVEMQYLVHELNCKGCYGTLTVDHRVEKVPFNMNHYH